MRKLLFGALATMLMSGSAAAADLPVKARPIVPAAAWEWTGCYVGVAGGANWGRTSNVDITAPFVGIPVTNPYDLRGGLIGGTVGCNYQIQQWVLGVENDLSWTNKRGTANEIPPFNTTATVEVRERWIDTLRARLGYKFGAQNQFLLYVTGGAAWAGTTGTTCLPGVFCASADVIRTGWTVGGGGELALGTPTPHFWWSVKVEYLYVDFGAKDYLLDPTLTTSKRISLTDNIVRAGVNLHF